MSLASQDGGYFYFKVLDSYRGSRDVFPDVSVEAEMRSILNPRATHRNRPITIKMPYIFYKKNKN